MGDKRAAVDVAAVEARAAKATKAPWTVHRFDKSGGAINYQVQQDSNEGDVISNVRDDDVKQAKGTALFIAASRTDVPALCAALREQDEELAHLKRGSAALRSAILAFTAEAPNVAPNNDTDRAIERLFYLLDPKTWPVDLRAGNTRIAECNDAMADLTGDLADKIKTLRETAEACLGGDFKVAVSL
jgi:hypothetical protein